MTASTGSFTTSDGTELLTRTWAVDDPRYDMLLVHGIGEHCGRYESFGAFFNGRGANVYSFDVRGHGASGGDRMDVDTWESLHRDIAEMAAATAAATGRPWVLYGHSLGGLQVAGYLIDGFEPLPNVAVLSAPAMVSRRSIDPVLKTAASLLSRVTPSTRIGNKIAGDQLSSDPSVGEAYFADPLVQTKVTVRFGNAIFSEQDRLVASHGDILLPTLVVHGADDTLVTPDSSAGLAASPGVERKVYPNQRHEMHNEPDSDRILGEIADWIEAKLR